MLEVLKALAAKVSGYGPITMTAMILIYMLATTAAVTNFLVSVSLITFLALISIILQCFK